MGNIRINNSLNFEVQKSGNHNWVINQEEIQLEVIKRDDHSVVMLYKQKIFEVQLVDLKSEIQALKLLVNGHQHQAEIRRNLAYLQAQIGIKNHQKSMKKELTAPMPGLIVGIKVKEGQQVQENDPLMVLKAMKMENIIKSPFTGTVKKILIAENETIEKGALMIQF